MKATCKINYQENVLFCFLRFYFTFYDVGIFDKYEIENYKSFEMFHSYPA
jgi:hypothetical protein